jgi:ATP-dependent helicase/nuclease subunit B
MPTNLLLAPVGAGKTEIALERLAAVLEKEAPFFSRIWVLLPSQRQQDAFRQRLIERYPDQRVFFNIELFDFYALYVHLLNAAGQPQRRLEDAARNQLLRTILPRLRPFEVFDRIADTPGFVRVVADFIYELKRNVIYPEIFAENAQTAKDRDLSRIYTEYQRTLQTHNLVDREGEGWLALELVEADLKIGSDVELLLVDGFDQFTLLQANLITVLANRADDTLITLTTVPGRDQTIGKRFFRAYERITKVHFDRGQFASVQPLTIPFGIESRHPALRHLVENVFLTDAVPKPSGGAVAFVEAPDPAQEVAAVLRQVKRRLLSGSRPDDVLIAVRDWERYRVHLGVYGRAYGLPLASHEGEKLRENPAITALLNLLDLHVHDFRRRDLLDVLRAPYFRVLGLDSQQVDLLERVSQAYFVIGGRDAWLEAIHLAATIPPDAEDEPDALLTKGQAGQLLTHLTAFFAAVTPPTSATTSEYVRWLEGLIGPDSEPDPKDETEDAPPAAGSLYMLRQLRAAGDRIVDRDLSALSALKNVLRSLIAAKELVRALDDEEAPLDRTPFLRELKIAIDAAKVDPHPNRSGHVLITGVTDARGLPHQHVFILGLSEGVFPRLSPEDPLYLDSERQRWTQAGVPLETQTDRTDDSGLFYELICLARESLTLSRPTIQNGAPWPESHLWRQVRQVFNDIQVNALRVGAMIRADEVASLDEVSLAVANSLNRPTLDTVGVYNWLVTTHYEDWARIMRGRHIELARMSRQPHDHYSGRLSDAALIAEVAQMLGPDHVWSASQFNDYAVCGFRFFAKRLLKLDAWEEPDEGMDSAQYGTLNHDILERVYRRLKDEGVTITPEHTETALIILHDVADELLHDAPQRMGFRASALWEHEKQVLHRKLESLIRADFSGDGPLKAFGDEPRQPYLLEAPFGEDGGFELQFGDVSLKVQGRVDRMDLQGDRVIVVDYKTGGTEIPVTEMERGRNFQMMLYLLAAQQILSSDSVEVTGGLFWHTGKGKASGAIRLDERGQEAISSARDHLARYLAQWRRGDFAAHATKPASNGKCTHYCDFREMCRVSIMNRRKD